MKWCKIIEVDGQQVLFWIDWSEDGQVALRQQVANDFLQITRSVVIDLKPDIEDDEKRATQQNLLNVCDEKMARHVLKTLVDFSPEPADAS